MGTSGKLVQAGQAQPPVRRWLSAASAVGLALVALWSGTAAAAGAHDDNVSGDLKTVINTGTYATGTGWATQSSNGSTRIKVLISNGGGDPEMTDLRAAILANGGSVFLRYYAVSALSALLPLDKVKVIGARIDVASLSPKRPTSRTASLLEAASGTVTGSRPGGPRTYSPNGVSGVSGISSVSGVDNSSNPAPDRYGHGTPVASIAVGRGGFRTPDSTGIAASAKVYDVKVLDDAGGGQVGDALAGTSSWLGSTGVFLPTLTLSNWHKAGSGALLAQGITLAEGSTMAESIALGEP